jgi:hypothetical protein
MEKRKKFIVKFLIVIVSFFCADGGRSFIFAENSVQIILNHNHENNGEEPHQHHLFNLCDDEKWIDTACQITSRYNSENTSDKFTGSVWQPPKLV